MAIKELMVVFGGGNEGIVDELHVYNTGKINFACMFTSICSFVHVLFYLDARDVVKEKQNVFGLKLSLKAINFFYI